MNLSWEMLFGVGAAVLFAALAYGRWQDKTRNRANDKVTEEATREGYTQPNADPQRREDLKKKLRPS